MPDSESRYPKKQLLLVDDEDVWVNVFVNGLQQFGFNNIAGLDQPEELMWYLGEHDVGTVLLDLNFPGFNGEDLLLQIKEKYPEITVIIVTGQSEVDSAVRCIKHGAYNYYSKDMDIITLISAIQHAVEIQDLRNEKKTLQEHFHTHKVDNPEAFTSIITRSENMYSIFSYIEAIRDSEEPVLIVGESGVGKELVAKAIHRLYNPDSPFVSINIAGLDENAFTDTLFGHVAGAFTGAVSDRIGLIEQARGGVLLLDEIGQLSLELQVKLLRVLQEHEYYPLGSEKPRQMSTRIISITNRGVNELVESKDFRQDFFYRISSHIIQIPPLRERRKDICLLLDHFLERASDEMNKKKPTPPAELLPLLRSHDFPGNVRELRSMIYDAVGQHTNKVLSMSAFENRVFRKMFDPAETGTFVLEPDLVSNEIIFGIRLPTAEKAMNVLIQEALARSEGNQSMAARMLSMNRATLIKRIKKYKLAN